MFCYFYCHKQTGEASSTATPTTNDNDPHATTQSATPDLATSCSMAGSSTETDHVTSCDTQQMPAPTSSPYSSLQHSQHTASSQETDSQLTNHSDKTYNPDTDSDVEADGKNNNLTEQPVELMTKYLVFESELEKLFIYCSSCGALITKTDKHLNGSMLSVTSECQYGHINTWHSQPLLRRMPAGNLLISSAILLSGSTFSRTEHFFNILCMPILHKSEFYRIQATYLEPTVNECWLMHQTAVLSVLSPRELCVCGDARSDSPGYNAKYTSYTIMDMETGLILDQQLFSLGFPDVENSVSMEKLAVDKSLEFLISSGMRIHTLATDRHVGVQCLMDTKYPDIKHQFDVWHVSKNIKKRLHAKALKKEATELMRWIPFIANHLFYSAQTCDNNPDLLREKWQSCLHHTANNHEWNGGLMSKCDHETVSDDTDWLTMGSPAHDALRQVVMDRRLLKDIGKLSDFCHTGQLETYHSMLLKYAPKRNHFQYGGMLTRLQLAALDHNNNAARSQTTDSSGSLLVRQVFSKGRKQWYLRNVYEKKDYSFLYDILSKIVQRRGDESISMESSDCQLQLPELRQNLAKIEKPLLNEAIVHHYKRM